jgi:hypothetical protein
MWLMQRLEKKPTVAGSTRLTPQRGSTHGSPQPLLLPNPLGVLTLVGMTVVVPVVKILAVALLG